MNKLKGKITLELTDKEFNYINELIVKDTAKAVTEIKMTNGDVIYACPNCGRPTGGLIEDLMYCRKCGQKMDMTAIAF